VYRRDPPACLEANEGRPLTIVDGVVYVGYGVFGPTGGVQALGLP